MFMEITFFFFHETEYPICRSWKVENSGCKKSDPGIDIDIEFQEATKRNVGLKTKEKASRKKKKREVMGTILKLWSSKMVKRTNFALR